MEQTVDGPPLLLTAKDLASCMQLSVRTIWRLRSAGKLPAPLEVGGAVRWRSDEFQKWVADGCRELSASKRKS
jgi:predicted DNA-binding transcriptional regulator AlpA